jgi:hypothetical protein
MCVVSVGSSSDAVGVTAVLLCARAVMASYRAHDCVSGLRLSVCQKSAQLTFSSGSKPVCLLLHCHPHVWLVDIRTVNDTDSVTTHAVHGAAARALQQHALCSLHAFVHYEPSAVYTLSA